jgi:hypothetical protein
MINIIKISVFSKKTKKIITIMMRNDDLIFIYRFFYRENVNISIHSNEKEQLLMKNRSRENNRIFLYYFSLRM